MTHALGAVFPSDLQRAGTAPVGNIDTIGYVLDLDREMSTGSERRIPEGCPLVVRGWALSADGHSGASEVVVTVDGLAAPAQANIYRRDVAYALKRPELGTSGFFARVPTGDLAQGSYRLSFHVVDRERKTYLSAPDVTIEIGAPAQGQARPERGRMTFTIGPLRSEPDRGEPMPPATIARQAVALVEGCVVDAKLDAPAGAVFVLVDGLAVNRGLYGYECSATAPSHASPPRCGFKVRFRTEPLQLGLHSFRIIAVSADGSACEESDAQPFEVVAPRHVPLGGALTKQSTTAQFERAFTVGSDSLEPASGDLRVERGRNVHVTGWAVDEPGRAAGVQAALLVDESLLFAAFYGTPRDDVAQRLGGPSFRNCGFVGAVATADLSPGMHSVVCLLQSADGSWLVGSERLSFEVTPAG